MTISLIHADPMDVADIVPQWGSIQAVSSARYTLVTSGTDGRPCGDGSAAPANYRNLALTDGDSFSGERCELGANERRYGIAGGAGTFMLFQPGVRYQTWFSQRLSSGFPVSTTDWQVVMQMKQTQPYTSDGQSSPIIEMDVRSSAWTVIRNVGATATTIFTAPAVVSRWTRFCYDITYSPDPAIGCIRLTIDDRAGATDFVAQYDSNDMWGATLTSAVGAQSGYNWSLADGEAIPSHLRLGIYRNSVITGSPYIDIANVQVYQVFPPLALSGLSTTSTSRAPTSYTVLHANGSAPPKNRQKRQQ